MIASCGKQIVVIGCWAIATDGIQWILQKQSGAGWRPVSYVRSTKKVLARCMRENGVEPEAAEKLLSLLRDYGDDSFADGVIPDVHLHTFDFRGKPHREANPPEKPLHAGYTAAVVGPVENYSPRSLRAARLPPHPEPIAHLRELNDWDRIRGETAWGRREQHVEPLHYPMISMCDVPCWEQPDDLAVPDFLKRTGG